ncbi:MAG: HEPN domain-containing protein [Armatimonadota bacterium]|nr:HEPN domain-containing protein [Armatimonadota bacterium]
MASRHEDWLHQAERDLQSARWAADGGFHEFISQQAAEKALKAVYQKLGGEAWGHALVGLLAGLKGRIAITDDIARCARSLDRCYVPARDPNGWERGSPKDYYTREDADYALGCGETIVRFCRGLLAQ